VWSVLQIVAGPPGLRLREMAYDESLHDCVILRRIGESPSDEDLINPISDS